MRPRPISAVVKTDDEIRAELKRSKASAEEIGAEIEKRQSAASIAQQAYDKKTSAPFSAGLQAQNQ